MRKSFRLRSNQIMPVTLEAVATHITQVVQRCFSACSIDPQALPLQLLKQLLWRCRRFVERDTVWCHRQVVIAIGAKNPPFARLPKAEPYPKVGRVAGVLKSF